MIKKLLRIIDKIYISTACAASGNLFTTLFNFRALSLGRTVRFRHIGNGLYLANDCQNYRYFMSKTQNFSSYLKGFQERALQLEKDYLLTKIKFIKDDLVIDCGANVGDLKLYFDLNNLIIDYIALEPSPNEYKCLEKNIAPSRSINKGLWFDNDKLDFFVSSDHADSSFIKPLTYTHIKSIPVTRMDQLFKNNIKIKLFKLEAEGAEPEVLIGCGQLLNNIEYISADLGYERGQDQETTFFNVTNFLLQNNFEIVDVNFTRLVALYRNKNFSNQGSI